MKFCLIYLSIFLTFLVSCTSESEKQETAKVVTDTVGFTLPETWTKDFRIYITEGGGMRNESVSYSFTYDTCNYVKRLGKEKEIKTIIMTDSTRAAILGKLKEFNVDKIRSIKSNEMTLDGESTDLCFYGPNEFCLTDGASSEIHKDDVANYSKAYTYLTGFVNPEGVK